ALAQQTTVALTAQEARGIFALPPLAGPVLASLGHHARKAMDRIRRTMTAPAAAASPGPEKAPAGLSGTGRSGISGLEGALALSMLVLAILPGLWALWSPATPQASAQALPAVLEAASGGREEAGPAPRSSPRSPSAAGDRKSRTASRSAANDAAGRKGAPVQASARKATQGVPPGGASSPRTRPMPAPRGARSEPTMTDAERARSVWAPKGGATPPVETAAAQDGTIASLSSPMSREPLTRRPLDVPPPTGFVVIDVRSLV